MFRFTFLLFCLSCSVSGFAQFNLIGDANYMANGCIQLTPDELRDAFARFKRLADERKAVTLYDVFEEVPVQ